MIPDSARYSALLTLPASHNVRKVRLVATAFICTDQV